APRALRPRVPAPRAVPLAARVVARGVDRRDPPRRPLLLRVSPRGTPRGAALEHPRRPPPERGAQPLGGNPQSVVQRFLRMDLLRAAPDPRCRAGEILLR